VILKPENSNDKVNAQNYIEEHRFEVQTIIYRAPEVAMGVSISPAADMWSLGCILIEAIIGQPLFLCENRMNLLSQMEQFGGDWDFGVFGEGMYYGEYKEYNSSCSLNRISLEEILEASQHLHLQSPFLLSFAEGLLQIDPSKRMTAKQVRTILKFLAYMLQSLNLHYFLGCYRRFSIHF